MMPDDVIPRGPQTFGRMAGDHATYEYGNPEAAVRLARSSPYVACDIETGSATGPGRWGLTAFSVATPNTSHVLDPEVDRDAIRDVLAGARRLVFHASSYDVPILCTAGLMSPYDVAKVDDTVITARLAWPDSIASSNRLGDVADRVLGDGYRLLKGYLESGFKLHTNKSKAAMFDELGVHSAAFVTYSAFDTIVTARIYPSLMSHLNATLHPDLPGLQPADAAYLDEREQTVNRLLLWRSALGIVWDDDAADRVTDELRGQSAVHRGALARAGVDPDLPATVMKTEILARLDAEGRVPPSWPRLKNGSLTTNKNWMVKLDDSPLVVAATELLKAERWVKDYGTGTSLLIRNGRIHPQVNVQATVSGRMTYSSPNLQQYPGQVRQVCRFERPATSFDWSSIEPVVLANLTGDATLYGGYEAGADIYQPVADKAEVTRKTAKTVVLAQMYGQGVAALSLRLDVTEGQARSVVAEVRRAMPGAAKAIDRIRSYGTQYGCIQTMSGRVVPLPAEPNSRRYRGYLGVNYLIQGSAYDLLSEAIYTMHQAGLRDALCVAVHDELVVHTDAAEDVRRIMTTPPPALVEAAGRTPVLRVSRHDLGTNWNEKTED